MTNQTNNKPIERITRGQVSASIWESTIESEGHTDVRYPTTIQKRFKNDKGEWQYTGSFYADDLPYVETVSRCAGDFIVKRMKKNTNTESLD